jgi:hypothetical protein
VNDIINNILPNSLKEITQENTDPSNEMRDRDNPVSEDGNDPLIRNPIQSYDTNQISPESFRKLKGETDRNPSSLPATSKSSTPVAVPQERNDPVVFMNNPTDQKKLSLKPWLQSKSSYQTIQQQYNKKMNEANVIELIVEDYYHHDYDPCVSRSVIASIPPHKYATPYGTKQSQFRFNANEKKELQEKYEKFFKF